MEAASHTSPASLRLLFSPTGAFPAQVAHTRSGGSVAHRPLLLWTPPRPGSRQEGSRCRAGPPGCLTLEPEILPQAWFAGPQAQDSNQTHHSHLMSHTCGKWQWPCLRRVTSEGVERGPGLPSGRQDARVSRRGAGLAWRRACVSRQVSAALLVCARPLTCHASHCCGRTLTACAVGLTACPSGVHAAVLCRAPVLRGHPRPG